MMVKSCKVQRKQAWPDVLMSSINDLPSKALSSRRTVLPRDVTYSSLVRRCASAVPSTAGVGSANAVTPLCGMQEFPCDHAFAQLNGTDNIVSFHTKRYSPQPMTIMGPGAGLEVCQQPRHVCLWSGRSLLLSDGLNRFRSIIEQPHNL